MPSARARDVGRALAGQGPGLLVLAVAAAVRVWLSTQAQFGGGSGYYVTIPRVVGDDFTIAFWLKTTTTGGSGLPQWVQKR